MKAVLAKIAGICLISAALIFSSAVPLRAHDGGLAGEIKQFIKDLFGGHHHDDDHKNKEKPPPPPAPPPSNPPAPTGGGAGSSTPPPAATPPPPPAPPPAATPPPAAAAPAAPVNSTPDKTSDHNPAAPPTKETGNTTSPSQTSPKPDAAAQSGPSSYGGYPGFAGSGQNTAAMLAYARQMLKNLPQSPQTAAALAQLDQAEAMLKANPNDPNAMSALSKGMMPGAPSTSRAPAKAPAPQTKKEPAPPAEPATAPLTRTNAVKGGPVGDGGEPIGSNNATPGLDPRQVLLDTTQALDQNPKDFNARAARSEALNALGDYQAAEEEANKALILSPRLIKALNARAFAYNKRGQYSLALADSETVLNEDPNNALGRLNKAMALEGLNHLREALSEYETAARIDPSLKTFFKDAVGRYGATVGFKPVGENSQHDEPPRQPAKLPSLWEYGLLIMGIGVPLALWAALKRPREQAKKNAAGGLLNGTYRIDKQIGEGGMGVVFEGTDMGLQRKVAIKKMRGDVRMNAMFLEEARLVAALKHPNLVEIYAVFQEKDEIYLVFEHLTGRPLDKLLETKGKLSPADTLHLIRQLGQALDYAHSKRIIHRDLKPANVMLTNDGSAKLMDFGIAHQSKGSSSSKFTRAEAWGTSWYMAPEQELGTVSAESDLYALGVMTYELLTAKPPFPGPDFRQQKAEMAFQPASLAAPGIPPSIDYVLARALAPLPDGRFHSGAEFAAAFAAALQTNPVAI